MFEKEIKALTEEYLPLHDELTTSDLQGCIEASARKVIGLNNPNPSTIMYIVDSVLKNIYDAQPKF